MQMKPEDVSWKIKYASEALEDIRNFIANENRLDFMRKLDRLLLEADPFSWRSIGGTKFGYYTLEVEAGTAFYHPVIFYPDRETKVLKIARVGERRFRIENLL